MKGVDFAVSDPSLGDASLSIAELTAAHTGTYQCKVKKAPGLDTRKTTLLVLGNVLWFYCSNKIKQDAIYTCSIFSVTYATIIIIQV